MESRTGVVRGGDVVGADAVEGVGEGWRYRPETGTGEPMSLPPSLNWTVPLASDGATVAGQVDRRADLRRCRCNQCGSGGDRRVDYLDVDVDGVEALLCAEGVDVEEHAAVVRPECCADGDRVGRFQRDGLVLLDYESTDQEGAAARALRGDSAV